MEDYLEKAIAAQKRSPQTAAQQTEAQVKALIAIAQELRKLNDREEAKEKAGKNKSVLDV